MSSEMWTDENLQLVEECGSVFFTHAETAVACGMSVDVFEREVKMPSSPIYQAFHRGRLISLLNVRKNIIKMATNGSGPAQSMVNKMLEDYEYKSQERS